MYWKSFKLSNLFNYAAKGIVTPEKDLDKSKTKNE